MRLSKQRKTGRRGQRGQTLLMFVLFLAVLILFVGLGIDLGFAYITKAQLSKAVDAAALAGMLNLSQGTSTASDVAQNTFYANYHTSGRDVGTVTPSITFSNDASNGNNLINVSASTSINTFFIRVLPQWHTMQVGANAQGTRSKLIMSIVLDRSGSMGLSVSQGGSDGGQYLPGAVAAFINNFSDTLDKAAMVSFATTPSIDFSGGSPPQPTQPFKQQIINAANALQWNGATFSQGGLTNGFVLLNNTTVPAGQNVVKAVVFFTDGFANTIQDTLSCPSSTLYNFGGNAPTENPYIGFFDPSTGDTRCGSDASSATTPVTMSGCSCNATTFRSAIDGAMYSFTRSNITADAEFRSIQVANDMRSAGIIVFSIGLGNDVNLSFLQQVANDPNSPTFNSNQPVGLALIANDATELSAVFRRIAQEILLRLTR